MGLAFSPATCCEGTLPKGLGGEGLMLKLSALGACVGLQMAVLNAGNSALLHKLAPPPPKCLLLAAAITCCSCRCLCCVQPGEVLRARSCSSPQVLQFCESLWAGGEEDLSWWPRDCRLTSPSCCLEACTAGRGGAQGRACVCANRAHTVGHIILRASIY